MKRLRRIVESITFRLALAYTLIFGASVGGLFAFVFWATAGFADQQVQEAIEADANGFVDSYTQHGLVGLVYAINRRSAPNSPVRDGVYLLVNSLGTPIAGNLQSWPQKVQAHDVWLNFTIDDLRTATPTKADVRARVFWIP